MAGFTSAQKHTVENLDDEFLGLLLAEDNAFEKRRAAYVKSHPEHFFRGQAEG
jgi:hypothetical protein